jgi:RNA polymerase sigma factor (sigma-70 family)
MATANLNDFFRRLMRGMAAETLGDHSDRQLVEQALARRDEAAFQTIVHRHGGMVYRVCLRVLQHAHDAEDAFQATFLVLARKLGTVRKQASLASWLHGVAYRVALKARAQSAARRRHELQGPLPDPMPPDGVTWKELHAALDAELDRLPDKWRLPLILCYLEGRTQDEAADQLGCSKSTLRRRMEDARAALGRRLRGRGIGWPALQGVMLFSDCMVSAAPGPGLVARVVEAAAAVAANKTVFAAASARVAALAQGVLKTMLLSKLKTAIAVMGLVLLVSLIPFGGLLLNNPRAEGQQIKDRQDRGAEDRKAQAEANVGKPKPAPLAVIVKAQLYEVDDAFYKKLSKAKRLSKEDLEELERQALDPPKKKPPVPPEGESLFKLLKKQKLILAGKEVKVDNRKEGTLLAWKKVINCLPGPEQVRKGENAPQKVEEGVSFLTAMQVSADRRYVRVKFTEKSTELEDIEKVKVWLGDTGKEAVAEIPFLKELVHSQVRDIPDGGSLLLPVQYRPRAAREKDRWFVLSITPRIYIAEEEEALRDAPPKEKAQPDKKQTAK